MNQQTGSVVIFSRSDEGEKIFSDDPEEEKLIKDLEKRFESYLEKLKAELQDSNNLSSNNEMKKKIYEWFNYGLCAYINILLLKYIYNLAVLNQIHFIYFLLFILF